MSPYHLTRLAALALLCLTTAPAWAQKPTEDVLFLRNGWILRGRILTAPSAEKVRIQTHDRSEFVFSRAEIDSTRRETVPTLRNIYYKRRGFQHYTELGALAGRNTSSSTNTSAFSFQTVNGYKFGQYLFTGLGIGIDLYATQSLLPLFGSVRGDFTDKGNVIPYYFIDAGYGINITGKDADATVRNAYSGGVLYAVGIGTKVIFNNNTGFLVSVGYRSQQTGVTPENGRRQDVTFERVAVRAGFTF